MSALRNILSGVDTALADQVLAVLHRRYGPGGPEGGWDTLRSSVAAFVSFTRTARDADAPVTDLADVLDVTELRATEARIRRAMYVIAPGVTQFQAQVDAMIFDDKVLPSLGNRPRSRGGGLPERALGEPWCGGELEVVLVDCGWMHHTNGAAVTLFTRRANGNSCLALCLYNDFFYVGLDEDSEALKFEIDTLLSDMKLFPLTSDPPGTDVKDVIRPYIVSVNKSTGMLRMNEFSESRKAFLKVTTSSPLVSKRAIVSIKHHFKDRASLEFFNTDEDFADKFLYEKGVASGDLVSLAEAETLSMNVFSSCDEAVMCQGVTRVQGDQTPAPLIMYYDVTTLSAPDTLSEPCGQISYMLTRDEETLHQGAICLGHSAVFDWYPLEEQVLTRFALIVRSMDPDFLVAFGRDRENMTYLLERMRVFGIDGFATQVSKRPGHCVSVRSNNAYYGCVSKNAFLCPGRAVINLADLVNKSHKETPGLKLHEVAARMGIECEPPGDRSVLALDDESRQRRLDRVAVVRRLDQVSMSTYGVWSMAQVMRLSVSTYLACGVSGQVMGRMRAACAERNFVTPQSQVPRGEHHFTGGKVIEPEPEFCRDPVIVIDFASMYPSIIQAYNICVSTVLDDKMHEEFMLDHPNGFVEIEGTRFVKPEVLVGLVPSILRELGEERARIKALMRREDPGSLARRALDARQNACKLTMNAFYGVGGNHRLPMYHPQVAKTIAAQGRRLLESTVEAAGLTGKVVYGDTDSVFLQLRDCDVRRALETGKLIAEDVNETLPPPVRLEVECVYKPFLILGKKRYCGAKYVPSACDDPRLEIKGLPGDSISKPPFARETLRRYLEEILLRDDKAAGIRVVREAVTKLLSSEYSARELAMSALVTRNAEEYRKTAPPFFQALERMRERVGVVGSPCVGERFFFVRTTKGVRCDDVAVAEEAGVSYAFDLKKYFQTDVVKSMAPLMNIVHGHAEVRELLNIDAYKITVKRKPCMGNLLGFVKRKRKIVDHTKLI